MRAARVWHGVTFAVVVAALVLQAVLVFQGGRVLDESLVPPLGTRLLRLISYFTIQSNIAVAIAAGILMRRPDADGPGFRVLRLDAVVAITVTGVVHFFLLRPLLNLDGADALADLLLHVIVPLLGLVGWLLFGPRPRITLRTAALALIWPVAWLGYTLLMGEIHGWYPYPFIDVAQLGYGQVLVNAAGVTVLFLVLFALSAAVDRLLPDSDGPPPTASR